MKTKIKFTVVAVLCLCLTILTSFVASNPEFPSSYSTCEVDMDQREFNSKLIGIEEVECVLCELVRVEQMWNGDGLLEGTAYIYEEGSEPQLFYNTECDYSPDLHDQCLKITVMVLDQNCTSFFVPCTKEDDPECVND